MSVQAISWVLDHSTARGTDRLVLISLANHAGRSPVDGAWESWPSVATITREAGLDRARTVQQSLARLEAAGAITREVNGAPDSRLRADRRPSLYRITVDTDGVTPPRTPSDTDGVTPPRTPSDTDGVTPPRTPSTSRGDASRHDGVTHRDITGCREASPEPSLEPSLEPPPLREPRGLGPAVDPSGGGNEPGTEPRPLTADERRQRIGQAAAILARQAADRTSGIGDPDAWTTAVAGRLSRQHATAGHRLLAEHPDLPPQVLADLLDDPAGPAAGRLRQQAAERATRQRARQLLTSRADLPRANPVPDIRALLRPTRPATAPETDQSPGGAP